MEELLDKDLLRLFVDVNSSLSQLQLSLCLVDMFYANNFSINNGICFYTIYLIFISIHLIFISIFIYIV